MKGIFIFIATVIILGNSAGTAFGQNYGQETNAHDWTGVYVGMLPCADCSGIRAEIRLNADLTYETAAQYSGKDVAVFQGKGHFKWNKTRNKIILEKGEGVTIVPEYFLVQKGRLTGLNAEGKKFNTSLPPNTFVFRKAAFSDTITGKYWKLIELNGKKIAFYEYLHKTPHLSLKTNGRVEGNDGCNLLTGIYNLTSGNKIFFSHLVSTKMACLDAPYQQAFKTALEQTENYVITGDTLSLNNAGTSLARFVAVYIK